MQPRPNPLTDELTDEAKAVLAAQFARLKKVLAVCSPSSESRQRARAHREWWERGQNRNLL
jgi:hypothetical protein